MTQQQAAAALEEYRAERGPALRRLRSRPEAQGAAPGDLLDGTPGSTAPLRDRTTARITALGTGPRTLDADPTRSRWPSRARHGKLVDPHPPEESLLLVDGFCADLPERHPALVERLVDALCERDGVVSVHRYGPAALVVGVPEWDEVRLKPWLSLWLERNLPH
ncbi:hypothetical protein AUQ48_10980 [Kocuria flava]|uniref:Uncharacterized protein n=1 Tax=Kocuria flava TaxID=446860 RepID=A0A2N4T338_9MICC|nr:hypothetical protein [Kocuria flava]PLC12645.1 hypothetical protein AUQ48_10980 [Kocuria flava]